MRTNPNITEHARAMKRPPRRVLVLGTGTNVGKTRVSLALARMLAQLAPALAVLPLKPVETGGTADAEALARVAQHCSPPRPRYVFPDPVSPHLAARRAGTQLNLQDLKRWVEDAEAQCTTLHCITLIETAGGAFSPLAPALTNAALVDALDARPILVAPDRLGVLHDVTATLASLRCSASIELVLSQTPPADASTGTNAAELERLGISRVAAILRDDDSTVAELAATLLAGA
jgi:dethiobiotin synthetase